MKLTRLFLAAAAVLASALPREDVNLGMELKPYCRIGSPYIRYCDISPDGSLYLTVFADNRAELFSTETGEKRCTLETNDRVMIDLISGITFSEDGKKIVWGYDGSLVEWNAETGKIVTVNMDNFRYYSSIEDDPSYDNDFESIYPRNNLHQLMDPKTEYGIDAVMAFGSPKSRFVVGTNWTPLVEIYEKGRGRAVDTVTIKGSGGLAAYAPDGSYFIVSSDSGFFFFSSDRKVIGEIPNEKKSAVQSLNFSANGSKVIAELQDNSILIIDPQTRKVIRQFGGEPSIRRIAFSVDGSVLLTANSHYELQLRDRKTGAVIETVQLKDQECSALALSSDNRTAAVGLWDGTVQTINLKSGKVLFETSLGADIGFVRFSRDDRELLAGSYNGAGVLFSLKTGKPICSYGKKGDPALTGADFSHDGKLFAVVNSTGSLRFFEGSSGKELKGCLSDEKAIQFAEDDRSLFTLSANDTVCSLDIVSGISTASGGIGRFGSEFDDNYGTASYFWYSPEKKRFPVATPKLLRGYLSEKGRYGAVISRLGYTDLYSFDSLVKDNPPVSPKTPALTAKVPDTVLAPLQKFGWETKIRAPWESPRKGTSAYVLRANYPQKGCHWRIETNSDDYTNSASGAFDLPGDAPDTLKQCAFSADGSVILLGLVSGDAYVVPQKRPFDFDTLQGEKSPVTAVNISADGLTAGVGHADGSVQFFTVKNGTALGSGRHKDAVRTISFSPDGTRGVSGSSDSSAIVWNTETGKEIRLLKDTEMGAVTTSAFSSDGKQFALGSDQGTVHIWKTVNGSAKVIETELPGFDRMRFSENGDYLIAERQFRKNYWSTEEQSVCEIRSGKKIDSFKTRSASSFFNAKGNPVSVEYGSARNGDDNAKQPFAFLLRMRNAKGTVTETVRSSYEIPVQQISADRAVSFVDNRFFLYSLKSGKIEKVYNLEQKNGSSPLTLKASHQNLPFPDSAYPSVSEYRFSGDGSKLGVLTKEGKLAVFDVKTLERLYTDSSAVKQFALNRDGSRCFTADSSNKCRIIGTNPVKLPDQREEVLRCWFSPDESSVVYAGGFQFFVIDAKTGKELWHGGYSGKQYPSLYMGTASDQLKFSDDGKYLASMQLFNKFSSEHINYGSGFYDTALSVWEAKSGKEIMRFTQTKIGSFAFSHDGKSIAVGTENETVIFDPVIGNRTAVFRGQEGSAISVQFSPDDSKLITGSECGTSAMWKIPGKESERKGFWSRICDWFRNLF